MPHRKQVPFLLALLEDDTPAVQDHIVAELMAFGPQLEGLVRPLWTELDARQQQRLKEVLAQMAAKRLADSWLAWLEEPDFHLALEQAMISLSEQEYGPLARSLSSWLNELADQFDRHHGTPHALSFMQFLFEDQQFVCVSETQQTHEHHLLHHLRRTRTGSPMALTCLALLVGGRVGIDLHGIFIRGHFMSIACQNPHLQMYNAHDGGKPLSRSSALYMEEALRRNCTWPSEMRAPVFEIVRQLLHEVIDSLPANRAKRYQALLHELRRELRRRDLID